MPSSDYYLPLITFASVLGLEFQGDFIRSTTPALWGLVYTTSASTNIAVKLNMFALGVMAMYKGASADWLLNVHVMLYVGLTIALAFFDSIMWDSLVIPVIPTSAPHPSLTTEAQVLFIGPMVLFNLMLLPFALLRQRQSAGGGMISCAVA